VIVLNIVCYRPIVLIISPTNVTMRLTPGGGVHFGTILVLLAIVLFARETFAYLGDKQLDLQPDSDEKITNEPAMTVRRVASVYGLLSGARHRSFAQALLPGTRHRSLAQALLPGGRHRSLAQALLPQTADRMKAEDRGVAFDLIKHDQLQYNRKRSQYLGKISSLWISSLWISSLWISSLWISSLWKIR